MLLAIQFIIRLETANGVQWLRSVTNVSEGLVTVSVKATKTGYEDLTTDDVTLQITPKTATITVDNAEKFFDEAGSGIYRNCNRSCK